jgi:hypothetical protein
MAFYQPLRRAMPPAASDPYASATPPARSSALVRPLLGAGLAFMEGAREASFRVEALQTWLQRHLVEPGMMVMPAMVQESGVGTATLDEAPTQAWAASRAIRLGRIVDAARVRCAAQLGGLVARPVDDRFLSATIFAGRVQRASGQRGPSWQPTPQPTDRLSDIVLSIFTADVLTHREEYDAHLFVCQTCGRVGFSQVPAGSGAPRDRCDEHAGPAFA